MRKFLVVLDDSRECLNAMRFAAMRAARTGGGVQGNQDAQIAQAGIAKRSPEASVPRRTCC